MRKTIEKTYCDFCGEEIKKEDEELRYNAHVHYFTKLDNHSRVYTDICLDCYTKLQDFIEETTNKDKDNDKF